MAVRYRPQWQALWTAGPFSGEEGAPRQVTAVSHQNAVLGLRDIREARNVLVLVAALPIKTGTD